jgi:hypothetical protein
MCFNIVWVLVLVSVMPCLACGADDMYLEDKLELRHIFELPVISGKIATRQQWVS